MRRAFVVVALTLLAGAPGLFSADQNDPNSASPQVRAEDPALKEALVESIMREAEQRSGRDWDPVAKADLRGNLLSRSSKELSAAAGGGHALEALMGASSIGSNLNEWVFTPVASCRILDTRPGSGIQGDGLGPLLPGTPFSFDVAGGAAAPCLIPFPTAKAASINFIAVTAAGNGNLRTWPWDSSLPAQPSTAIITYTNGFNTSNAAVIAICNTATSTGGSCADDLFVQTNASSSHVVADVFGYFSAATGLGTTSIGTSAGAVSIADGLCHTVTNCSLTNTSSGTRSVIVKGAAIARTDHTVGIHDEIVMNIATTATACGPAFPTAPGNTKTDVNQAHPTGCCVETSHGPIARFTLASGATQSYFLNAIQVLGANSIDEINSGAVICQLE